MPLSVTAPIDQALRRTGTILFRNFDASKSVSYTHLTLPTICSV